MAWDDDLRLRAGVDRQIDDWFYRQQKEEERYAKNGDYEPAPRPARRIALNVENVMRWSTAQIRTAILAFGYHPSHAECACHQDALGFVETQIRIRQRKPLTPAGSSRERK